MFFKVLYMETKDYLKDIQEIKSMMSQSSRFISLSGLSGILAGGYSLIGGWFTYKTIYFDTSTMGNYSNLIISQETVYKLISIASAVIILSIFTGIVLSYRKAQLSKMSRFGIKRHKDWSSILGFRLPRAVFLFYI